MVKISIIIPLGANSELISRDSIKIQKNEVKTILEYGSNPSRNRNKGIRNSITEFVGFINGHTILAKDWSEKMLDFFSTHKDIDIVGGPQLTPKEDGVFAQVSGYALSSIFGAWKISNRYAGNREIIDADETMITSANLICRKRVFKKVKFDETIYPGEDPKFISDAKKQGFKIAYSPEIITYNKRRSAFWGLIKQIYNYGINRPKKEGLIETLKRPFFIIPSLFVLYLSLLVILGIFGKLSLIIVLPLFLYILLDIGFTIINSILNGDVQALFMLPFIYPAIHLSYGIGFLIASFKKWGRRK